MTTIEVSSENETSERPRYHQPPRWLVRSLVACPKCRSRKNWPCWGRKSNHIERVRAAEAILVAEGWQTHGYRRPHDAPRSLGA